MLGARAMIERIQFDPGHLAEIDPAPIFEGETHEKTGYFDNPNAYAHTLVVDGKILGCLGGELMWAGVAEVWALFDKRVRDHAFGITKVARDTLDFYERELNLHRLQAAVKPGFHYAYKWAKTLGFAHEGTMYKYGQDGSNYWRMARVR